MTREVEVRGSGAPEPEEDGRSDDWTPAFPGQRPPFKEGNEVAVKHGAHAVVKLGPRAAELAVLVQEHMGGLYRESDALAVHTLGLTMARIEAAEAALGDLNSGTVTTSRSESSAQGAKSSASRGISVESLEANLRGWVNTQRRLLNDLGLTPAARLRFGREVAQTRHVVGLASLPDTDAEADEIEEGEVS